MDLADKIRHHRKLYYAGTPELSDEEFDALVLKLKEDDPDHPVLVEVGSPDGKVEHRVPMGSLGNVFTEEECLRWIQKVSPSKDFPDFLVQPKLDGFSLSAEYKDGRLVRVLTRGDGKKGEDITRNARLFQGVLEELPEPVDITMRGEGVVTKPDFETYNENHPDQRFSNRRNGAAGLAKRKDPCEEHRLISVRWFALYLSDEEVNKHSLKSERGKMLRLASLVGEENVVDSFFIQQWDHLKQAYEAFVSGRDDYPIDCDGFVLKLDDFEIQSRLGFEGLNPRFQVAYKFPAESAVVTVLGIVPKVNPSGRITPLASTTEAILDGARLGGSFACHNWDWVQEKGVSVGAKVKISRHGGVIPQIDETIAPGDGENHEPSSCPSCGGSVSRDGSYLYCDSRCLDQKSSLEATVKKFEWKGFGSKTLDKLVESGVLPDAEHFWLLTLDKLVEAGVGEANGNKVLSEIKKKSSLTFPMLLSCLAIHGVSEARFQTLFEAGYDTCDKLEKLVGDPEAQEALTDLEGFGETVVRAIVEGLGSRLDLLRRLVPHVDIKEAVVGDSLAGVGVQVTGKVTMGRKQLKDKVVAHGGKFSWKKELSNILVCNEPSSTAKYQEAQEKGYEILTEQEFLARL